VRIRRRWGDEVAVVDRFGSRSGIAMIEKIGIGSR